MKNGINGKYIDSSRYISNKTGKHLGKKEHTYTAILMNRVFQRALKDRGIGNSAGSEFFHWVLGI